MKFKMHIIGRSTDRLIDLEKTADGWLVSGTTTDEGNLKAEKDGTGGFFKALGPIVYPSTLPTFLVRTWNQVEDDSENPDRIQKQIELMAKWIGDTDSNPPAGLEY